MSGTVAEQLIDDHLVEGEMEPGEEIPSTSTRR